MSTRNRDRVPDPLILVKGKLNFRMPVTQRRHICVFPFPSFVALCAVVAIQFVELLLSGPREWHVISAKLFALSLTYDSDSQRIHVRFVVHSLMLQLR